MTIKQYRAFLAVAKHQSFSEATEQTGLSQPSLSRLIKQLEDELEVELIDRYHRPLQLTDTGHFFYKSLKILVQELDTLTTITKKMGKPANTLTIGFVPSILYGFLPEIIAILKQQAPELEVHLQDVNSYEQIDALKSGKIDVGLGRFELNDPHIKQILLRQEKYVVALPKNHKLKDKYLIHLEDIVADTQILYHQTHLPQTTDNQVTEPILRLYANHGLTPLSKTEVSDLQIALGLVAAGEGVTLVPASIINERKNRVIYKSLLTENVTTPIYLQTLTPLPNSAVLFLQESIYKLYEDKGISYIREKVE